MSVAHPGSSAKASSSSLCRARSKSVLGVGRVSGASETKRGCTASVTERPPRGEVLRRCIVAALGRLYDFAPMADFAVRVLINALALIVVVWFVPNIEKPNEIWELLVVAAIFGLVNSYLKPIVKLLSLPLNLMTFGLVGLVVNTLMLLLVALLSSFLDLGFTIAGWPGGPFTLDVFIWAFVAALVISIVSTILSLVRRLIPGV